MSQYFKLLCYLRKLLKLILTGHEVVLKKKLKMSKLVLVFICIVRLIITVSALILLKNQPIIMLTINIIEPELYMNEHWIVPYNVDILCLPFLFTLGIVRYNFAIPEPHLWCNG